MPRPLGLKSVVVGARMDNIPRSEKHNGWLVALLVVPLLLVGYVLSIGPATRLAWDNRIEFHTWFKLYRPILVVERKWEPAGRAVCWYCEKFGADPGTVIWRHRSTRCWSFH